MFYKTTALIIAIFFSFSSYALSLEEAILAAKENNRNLKYFKHKTDAAKAQRFGAVTEFLPEISANANYGNKENRISGAENNSNKERYEEIRAKQSIFEGFGSIMRYKEADYNYMAQNAQRIDKKGEIVMKASQIYCDFYLDSQKRQLYQENQKILEKILKLAKKRRKARLINISDYIKFKYEALDAKRKYFEALATFNKSEKEFKNIVGLRPESITEPKIIAKKFNQNQILKDATTKNKAVKSAYYQYLATKYAHHSQKSQFSPKVSVVALASRQRNVVYLNQRDLNTQSVYLNLEVPLFQKGTEYSNLSKASSERLAAKESYEIAKNEAQKQALQALDEYNLYRDLVNSSKELSNLAKNRLKIYQRRKKAKNIDQIEFLRAKIEYNQYLIEQLQAKINLVKSYYQVNYFAGRL